MVICIPSSGLVRFSGMSLSKCNARGSFRERFSLETPSSFLDVLSGLSSIVMSETERTASAALALLSYDRS